MADGTYRSRYGLPGKDVKLLHARWVKQRLMEEDWESFDDFVKWASESGYVVGANLHRYDAHEPHGPDNSFWYMKKKKEKPADKTVAHRCVKEDKIPTKHPCPSCPHDNTCSLPCIARQLWWDIQMAKLRKVWNVNGE